MRHELTDHEWAVIKPMLPDKPRGVPRVNDRRVLNGIFWVLRSGAPWRDLPEAFGPCTATLMAFLNASIGSTETTHAWLQRFSRDLITPWRAIARNSEQEWDVC